MARQKAAGSNQKVFIPARHAKAALVKKGRSVKVINTHGTQVVDCWALNPDNLGNTYTAVTEVYRLGSAGHRLLINRVMRLVNPR